MQGIDYAYTLQGWLKGINSTGGTESIDMGQDGKTGSQNQFTARDALGLTLNYFGNDYTAINGTPFPAYSAYLPTDAYRPLYNGNISSSSVYQKKFDYYNSPGGGLIFYNYRYDQLNRLTAQDAFNGFNSSSNSWSGITSMNENLKERIAYDANGNIKKYLRKSITGTTADMDSLNYYYYPGTNQLKRVTDNVPASAYVHPDNRIIDIDNQADNNYGYDPIGNLIRDDAEKITGIKWNVYGKIEEINKLATTAAPATNIKYSYDAMGNRISQVVTSGGTKYYTWYVRDAEGNIMSTYNAEGANSDLGALTLKLSQYFVYGSSRLGLVTVDDDNVDGGPGSTEYYYNERNFGYDRGTKEYELTNHLGNVLATLSDRKFPVTSGSSSLIDHYEPHIVTAQDYYPFGMLSRVDLPGSGKSYKFGFNGKLNDNEVKGGLGNQQDYGMRIYDPRVGRFLSVDPLASDFPWFTPYQFAGNKPIMAIDLDGLEPEEAITVSEEKKGPVLRVSWKAGNGKVVQMVRTDGMGSKVFGVIVKLGGGYLNLLRQFLSSPSTSSQDVAKGSYPRVAGTANEDKFWEHWIGPGRNFPLPPINSVARAQWLADYWPQGLPVNLPSSVNIPSVDSKPVDEEEKDDGYITLYRGVGEDISPSYLYILAKEGTAWPKGLLPGVPEARINRDADMHTAGDNTSIWISWTSDKSMAEYFARGPMGTSEGVVLSKRFKRSQLVVSGNAALMQEGEYLVPGVVTGADTRMLDAKNRKR